MNFCFRLATFVSGVDLGFPERGPNDNGGSLLCPPEVVFCIYITKIIGNLRFRAYLRDF